MTDILDLYRPKHPCVHKNEADNCHLCKTKGVSMTPMPGSYVSPEYERPSGYKQFSLPALPCKPHSLPDCWVCDWLSEKRAEKELARYAEVARINAINIPLWEAAERAEKLKEATRRAAVLLGSRCFHDAPAVECGLCRLAEADYDRDRYRSQISKALTDSGIYQLGVGRKGQRVLPDGTKQWGEKDFGNDQSLDDLKELIDIEMLKATRYYGPKMNEELAYTVARNAISKFQQRVIEEISTLVDLEWTAMPPDFHARALALFNEVASLEKLEALSNDDRAEKERRDLARQIVVEYGVRRSLYESLDEPDVDEETGEKLEISAAEIKIHEQERVRDAVAPELLKEHRANLMALVEGWRNNPPLYKVGQAVLAGTYTARGIPGIKKSTADRLYRTVIASFQAHIRARDARKSLSTEEVTK